VIVLDAGAFGPEGEHRLLMASILLIRNVRRLSAASRSDQVTKHQIHIGLDSEREKQGIFEAAS